MLNLIIIGLGRRIKYSLIRFFENKFILRLIESLWYKILEDVLFIFVVLFTIFNSNKSTKNQPNSKKHEVVTVTCHDDRLSFLVTYYSLRLVSNEKIDFYYSVVDDGTLTEIDRWLFKKAGINEIKKGFSNHFQAVKYIDLKQLFPNKIVLLLDSDVIFYRYPSELFLKKPSFMKDYASRYVLSNEEIQYFFGLDPMFAVNVGVGVVDTKIIDNKLYYRIENSVRKVAKSRIVEGYFTEQTAYAILMKDIENFKHLPKEYFLLARRRFNKEAIPKNVICIHYTSIFKNQRVVDSLKYLLKTRCFKKVLNNNQFPTY